MSLKYRACNWDRLPTWARIFPDASSQESHPKEISSNRRKKLKPRLEPADEAHCRKSHSCWRGVGKKGFNNGKSFQEQLFQHCFKGRIK